MATYISPPFPQEQLQQQFPSPPQQEAAVNAGASSSAWKSSGSIGPFFAVMSVLTVLAIISCLLGRICRGRKVIPPEKFNHSGCFGRLRCKFCIGSTAAVGGALGDKAVDAQIKISDDKAIFGL